MSYIGTLQTNSFLLFVFIFTIFVLGVILVLDITFIISEINYDPKFDISKPHYQLIAIASVFGVCLIVAIVKLVEFLLDLLRN